MADAIIALSGGTLILAGGTIAIGGVAAGTAAVTYGGTIVLAASDNFGNDVNKLWELKGTSKTKGDSKVDKQRKGTPGNNQAQNKQTRDAANKYKLNKDQQRQLHDEVTAQNYTYKEIEQIAKEIKEGR